jgi:hypothetical protein
VSFKEDTLWDSRVLNTAFNDVDSVVVEVVIDDALAKSKVLSGIFNDWFLEVSLEV